MNAARPGDAVLVHGGTYAGTVVIRGRSNAPDRPVVVQPAGDGRVTLQARLDRRSCAERRPATDRTIQILEGSDYWAFQGLTILGGIYVAGRGTVSKSALADRSLPGRLRWDPVRSRSLHAALGVDGANGIVIRDNDLRGRGVHTVLASYGQIVRNEISNLECGVGAAVWINTFSDGWLVQDNFVHDMEESVEHWMNEGIRMGRGSSYNLVERNVVDNMPGRGRAVSTDVYASWNMIRANRGSRTYVAFNEQLGGWGNVWAWNVSERNRRAGFQVYLKGGRDASPNGDTPATMRMVCNESRDEEISLLVGAVQRSLFLWNRFRTVKLSPPLERYWRNSANVWNGSSQPPSKNATPSAIPC